MRATLQRQQLDVVPGAAASLIVDVVNTDAVIDGISARVIGLPEECVRTEPALLPLFPDSVGQLRISIAPPTDAPAGRHPLAVEITSHGARAPVQYHDVDLVVAPRPELTLSARPKLVRARRSARFVLEVANPGNVKLAVGLDARDADRSLTYRFSRPSLVLEPGTSAAVMLTARAPRLITGGDIDRNVNVSASARQLDQPPDSMDSDAEIEPQTAEIQFRQRPLLTRGLLTALILAGIVALWAGAFLFGLAKVFGKDPLTKNAPASFFSLTKADASGALAVGYQSTAAVLAGALPKNGQLPPGEGSQITGTVLGASDHQPVGRILVQAIRIHDGKQILVSSAGTQADGTYTLAGLFPISYYLRFTATGFHSVWYSGTAAGATSIRAAQAVPTTVQGTTTVKSLVIRGRPASISGSIDPGDTLRPVITQVSARLLVGATDQEPAATAKTDASGKYTLKNLPAPASYELTFTAQGYETSAIVDNVSGGEQRLEPTITLSAGEGQISGVVDDGAGQPIGGATVSTLVNGSRLTVLTPTVGQVGAYSLDHLPTPGTYVVTFSAPGHGTKTKIVDVGVGQEAIKTHFDATLIDGTGSVTGRVLDTQGHGLGNVTLTVGGAASTAIAPSTTTLTGDPRGAFVINGLAAPRSYTLTAELPGYRAATVPFTLAGNSKGAEVTIHLSRGAGSIGGEVTGRCPQPRCAGAAVTATNGLQVWTTAVGGPGGALPHGGYLITGLPPGTYSVTVTEKRLRQQTAIVTVADGESAHQDLRLGG